MYKWLQAIYLVAGSKKGISSNQLHRILGVTLKTAWFMSHRIREAMRDDSGFPLSGIGATVEVDEAFNGRESGTEVQCGVQYKMKAVSLVERGSGCAKPFVVDKVSAEEIEPIVTANIRRETRIMTEESHVCRYVPILFYQHQRVNHSAGEYVRGTVHTNTIEGYFSIFKRGMRGIYQHRSKKHLHRYLAALDFRHTNRSATGIETASAPISSSLV